MATRGCIGRPISDTGVLGVYHHWDSYPSELGATLWGLYHGFFGGDVDAMTAFLIDEHPAGWSSIIGADFTAPAGFGLTTDGPVCYCHGERSEEPAPIEILGFEALAHDDLEWVYVLHPRGMDVLEMESGHRYEHRGFFAWTGDQPDWDAIETGAVALGGGS